MNQTDHKILFSDARSLSTIEDESIHLVVTSPPYPMIEMWDELYKELNPEIAGLLENGDGNAAFELMHRELDKVWKELFRVTKPGGFVCINIGDATRSLKDRFRMYSNHARTISYCIELGFDNLPLILWRKQTNAPNKFMGSGVLPAGAYVTLEHEHILIFRKDGKRAFNSQEEKYNRKESCFFWEERNVWFSDTWDFKGTKQDIHQDIEGRKRSAAYPFELAHRLVNMYSVKGDTVLDPFLGMGTTTFAAMGLGRNSIGVEIEESFKKILIKDNFGYLVTWLNQHSQNRLNKHDIFVKKREGEKGPLKHKNEFYGFPVVSGQESEMYLNPLLSISCDTERNEIAVDYKDEKIK